MIEIDLADIKEPVLCAPNDPDDARLLSEVAGQKIDEVFIAYTDYVNLVTQRPTVKQLLPLKPRDFKGMAAAEYVADVDISGAENGA